LIVFLELPHEIFPLPSCDRRRPNLSWAGSASAYKPGVLRELADAIETAAPVAVPAAGSIEVGFSPKGGAEALVLRVIDSAKTDIKALSYSFTSPRVVAALLRAAKRGVAVSLVADYKNNITDDRSGRAGRPFPRWPKPAAMCA
jgi:phosphatidylserine/phosphatidylglycerophosphate/cardiolipin synthase-like enzyme